MSNETVERLDRIKRRYAGTVEGKAYRIDVQDVAWLINEVEAHQRVVKELEAQNDDFLRQIGAANVEINRLEAQPSLSDAIKEVEKMRGEKEASMGDDDLVTRLAAEGDVRLLDDLTTRLKSLGATVRALRAALEESEAHNRVLRERLVIADGVYDVRGEYTFHAQTAIHRAVSELQSQLAAVTQERDALSLALKKELERPLR